MGYYKELRAEPKKQKDRAASATSLYWQYAEHEFQKLINIFSDGAVHGVHNRRVNDGGSIGKGGRKVSHSYASIFFEYSGSRRSKEGEKFHTGPPWKTPGQQDQGVYKN